MKPLLLTFILIFASCAKHPSTDTVEPYDAVKEKAASYLEQLKDFSDEKLFPDRCDKLTFKSLAAAFVSPRFDISAHEWKPGQWHRDVAACYPEDSRSEVSFDNLIGVLHKAWTSNDRTLLVRINNYAVRHNYVMGEGDTDLTRLPQIGLIVNEMMGAQTFTSRDSNLTLGGTHNDHLLAITGWLKVRYAGYLESSDLLVLRNLRPNPLLTALLQRVDDGTQYQAIKYLSEFPDTLPLETGIESWGSAPSWLYFFLVKGIIDGK